MNKKQLKAIQIAEKVFSSINDFVKPGLSEKEVAKLIRARIKKLGAKKESFKIIVASGKKSYKIHGFASGKKIRQKDIIMFDFGALYKGWRSDITRTYVLGKANSKQKKLYAILKKAQMVGIKKIKHGVNCRDIDKAVRSYIEKSGYGRYFIHSTGHGIGKKTHEKPRLSKGSRDILKTGMVVTVEPGIYIRGWGGMRIEDMVLVTKKGYKILTNVKRGLSL